MGKRNRLINCPLPEGGSRAVRHSLLINAPSPPDLWAMLTERDSPLSFPIPSDMYESEGGDGATLASPGVYANGVLTNQAPKETHKTLRNLMKKAKEFTEEKGLNALHLAFGFLNWVDGGTDSQPMRSPLLLLPVKLTQDDLFSPIVLSGSDEEISANYSLHERLHADFGITLPAFSEELSFSSYLEEVRAVVEPHGWSISNDCVQLSMFSFMKINMYRDIERNAAKIIDHPIIRALNGEALYDSTYISELDGYEHDKTDPREVFSVLDSDSSQQDAILLAKSGASFVLQGPPGTGKSQTITNIISELISDGKKVLFVSEKMAALEVVHKRLTNVGLAPFCLTLHSHNAKRREILEQLSNTIQMSRMKADISQDAYSRLYRLKDVRSSLNGYAAQLHTPVEPLGKTIYQVIGFLAKHEDSRDIDYAQRDAELFTPQLLADCELALEEASRIVSISGYQETNPWNDCVIMQPPTFEFRQSFSVNSDELLELIEMGKNLCSGVNAILGSSADWGLFDVEIIQALYDFALTSPKIPPSWVFLDLDNAINSLDACAAALRDRDAAQEALYSLPLEAVSTDDPCAARKEAWESAQNSLLQNFDIQLLSLDVSEFAARYRTQYRSFFSRLGGEYKQDRKTLLSYYKSASKLTYLQELEALSTAEDVLCKKSAYQNQSIITGCNEILTSHYAALSCALGLVIDDTTDFDNLVQILKWCLNFKTVIDIYSLGSTFIEETCARSEDLHNAMDASSRALGEWSQRTGFSYQKFAELFSTEEPFQKLTLSQLAEKVRSCRDNFVRLEHLVDYRKAEERLRTLGIAAYLRKAKEISLPFDELVPVFKKCFFRSWLDEVIPTRTSIREFRRLRQDGQIASFRELDKSHLEISKALVLQKLISRLPNFDTFSANGEIALLRREMAKQRKLMPTRLLIANLPNLLPALKPCVMMSPLSISTYLGSSDFEFDAVIFDEASQVRTEDALGAIFRAGQVIIAGDSKQLPPTDFFTSSISVYDDYTEDEDGIINDAGAYESLLDESALLPTQTLLWHYRSRHEHLIAFSNAKIYKGSLTTFPSSSERSEGLGVEYVHVPDGIYDRGGRNGNKSEAAQVAKLVFEHFQTYPDRTLGIIAFGEVQQNAIIDAIIETRRNNPAFEPFFKEDRDEAIFIKNLETVQGDERDTIIFSIGYAPDATGKFTMNFGPLSREGGERRLNVAVTRARYNLKLVGSILPTDIITDRVSSDGPKLLRQYIDFAINGTNAITGELTVNEGTWFDSPFEASVYEFLAKNGYNAVTQVGCSGYRIDMAIRHPNYDGRFAIGIECDGAMYHSARTARERDRLRQTVLEDMGWNIYRIWSTDWVKNRNFEGARLLASIENAISNYREPTPYSHAKDAKMTDFLDVSTQTPEESSQEGAEQKALALRSSFYGCPAKEVPPRDMAAVMLKVLEIDYGLDKVGLFRDTSLYGYGWQRQGSVIKEKFEKAFDLLIGQGRIDMDSAGKLRLKK